MDRPRHFLDSPPDVSGPKGAPTAFLGAATRRPPSLPFAQIAAPTRAPPVPTERRHRSLARRLLAVAARRQTTRGFGERHNGDRHQMQNLTVIEPTIHGEASGPGSDG